MRGMRAAICCLLLRCVVGLHVPPAVAMAPQNDLDRWLRSAYAWSPMPAAYAPRRADYDAAYHLDAGDKLRVVVYGQEGLTNTYAIDAGGSITMPLIGAVPARGRTPAGLAAEIAAKLRHGYIRDPSVAVEIEAYRPFFILGEVAAPGQYPYVPNMTRRERGGDRRRLLAARPARPRHPHPHRRVRFGPHRGAARHRRSAPAIPSSSANAGSDHAADADQPLRILHAVRAPVGGIFRHILDLANGQAERGHHVGIIADSLTGGERAEAALAEIAPRLKLGVRRVADPPRTPSCRPHGLGAISCA